MTIVYKVDAQKIFIGAVQINSLGPVPIPCFTVAPPETTGSEVARWNGKGWDVLTERPPAPEPLPPTDDEKKQTGIEILGVMCSATKEDQMGLTAVGLDYSMTTAGGGTFSSTKFEFSNGNTLVITADNFSTIYNLWVPFRRSFFTPGN